MTLDRDREQPSQQYAEKRDQAGVARRSSSGLLTRQQVGAIGERAACDRLLAAGYAIKTRNWRCRAGELDIIAEHEGRIVFVEVRTRVGEQKFGTAAESVDYRKQRQVRELALIYLRSIGMADSAIRFDVVAVTLGKNGVLQSYKHIEAAF